MELIKKGFSLIISAPSGTGKSTLIDMLIQHDSSFSLSVSATTRARRNGEVDGVNYFYKSNQEFDELVAKDAFLEYAEVFGSMYGTLKDHVGTLNNNGKNVIFDIDPVGASNLKLKLNNSAISIFIMPPNMTELRNRLVQRDTESLDVIERRMSEAQLQIEEWRKYDYIIVNNNIQDALNNILQIVHGYKHSSNNIIDIK